MWNNLKFLLPLLIIGLSFSCRTIKPVNGGAPIKILNTKKLMDSIHHHEPKMKWAKFKADAKFTYKEEESEVTLNFRIKRDSLIWVNVSSFGVKAARAFFEKDSIKGQFEFPKKSYFFGTFEDFEKKYNITLSYFLIEDFLLGNSYINHLTEKNSAHYKKGQYHLFSHRKRKTNRVTSHKAKKSPEYIYSSWVNPRNYKCDSITIIFPENNVEININYKEWVEKDNAYFPTKLSILFKPDNYRLDLEYKSIRFNTPLKFPRLKINENYEEIKLDEN